jgi:hypothetical protein
MQVVINMRYRGNVRGWLLTGAQPFIDESLRERADMRLRASGLPSASFQPTTGKPRGRPKCSRLVQLLRGYSGIFSQNCQSSHELRSPRVHHLPSLNTRSHRRI